MPTLDKDQYTKAETAELIRETEERAAEALEVAKREAQMTDAEKAVYSKLEGDAKSEFLFASADERQVEVVKSQDSNPVVYTATNGDVFHKNDDARLVSMAKERDQERKDFLKMQADRAQDGFEKRAQEELAHLPGTVQTHAAILKAIDGIKDEAVRDEAIKTLKAQNAKMAPAFREVGSAGVKPGDNANNTGGRTAHEELDQLAKDYVKAHPEIGYYAAYDLVAGSNPELAKRAVQEG